MLKKNSHEKKLVVLIGDGLRHQYFLFQLNSKHNISAVFIEKSEYPQPIAKTENEKMPGHGFLKEERLLNIKLLLQP